MLEAAGANCRTVPATRVEHIDTRRGFSTFSYVERFLCGTRLRQTQCLAFRRLFCQMRDGGGKGLIVETIPPAGAVADEQRQLYKIREDYERRGLPDLTNYELRGLRRLTFWRKPLTPDSPADLRDADAIGYAILKHDHAPDLEQGCGWHVFESVFVRPAHPHGYLPCEKIFTFAVGQAGQQRVFRVPGVLFCEQNGLNKSCAQVAIRSLCADPDSDGPTYSRINALARRLTGREDVHKGLYPQEMAAVIRGLGFGIDHISYVENPRQRRTHPYQRYLYAGMEGGGGALLGFNRLDNDRREERHVIPVFGHTFNRYTWVPRSERAHFRIGQKLGYLPSDRWLSDFISHDDRLGANFHLPRSYLQPAQVTYAASLIRPRIRYSGWRAEVLAYAIIRDILNALPESFVRNRWVQRLRADLNEGLLVLRPVPITGRQYLTHLRGMRDWRYRCENPEVCGRMAQVLADDRFYWMVELSLPELFPTHLRKLGEVLLDATLEKIEERGFDALVLARIVNHYYAVRDSTIRGRRLVWTLEAESSSIRSHTAVIRSDSPLAGGPSASPATARGKNGQRQEKTVSGQP